MKSLTLICTLILSPLTCLAIQESSPCSSSPCENGGECLETAGFNSQSSRRYSCICPREFTGINCNLPPPKISCGNQSIEVLIDKRIVIEQDLEDDTSLIYFDGAKSCNAVERGGSYHLKVDAPFYECGLTLQRGDPDGFIFKQRIVWNEVDRNVERPTVLLDFQCNYTDRYNVVSGALLPTVTTVQMKTSYGTFTVQLDLYKSDDFSAESKHSTRPVIAIEQQVCVPNRHLFELCNRAKLGECRTRTLGAYSDEMLGVYEQRRNWRYIRPHFRQIYMYCTMKPAEFLARYVESDITKLHLGMASPRFRHITYVGPPCVSDETTTIIANGEGSDARFCFQMFKWRESMDSVFLNCLVNVCNVTAFPDFCRCQNERKRRSIEPVTIDQQRQESKRVSSELIRVVNKQYLDDWLDFMHEDQSENLLQDFPADDPSYDDYKPFEESSGPSSAVLIPVGVVLMVALVVLGVVAGVYFNFKKANVQKLSKAHKPLDVRQGKRGGLPMA